MQSDTRSHWAVKGPIGATLEWDAVVINDKPNELIAWRTEGARVESAGSVRFEPRPDGSTLVRVALQYSPPGGGVTHMISSLFGEDPGPGSTRTWLVSKKRWGARTRTGRPPACLRQRLGLPAEILNDPLTVRGRRSLRKPGAPPPASLQCPSP